MPQRTALAITIGFFVAFVLIGQISPKQVQAQSPQWTLFKTSRTGFVFRSTGAASPAQIGFTNGGAKLGLFSAPAGDGWSAVRFVSIHPNPGQNSSVGFTARPIGATQPGFLFWSGDGGGTPSSNYVPLYAQTPSATAIADQVATKRYVDSKVSGSSQLRVGPKGCGFNVTTNNICYTYACDACGGGGCTSAYLDCNGVCGGTAGVLAVPSGESFYPRRCATTPLP